MVVVVIGGCYKLPVDSDYRDASIIGNIQAKLMAEDGKLPILLGDMNARMWQESLLTSLWPEDEPRYDSLEDNAVNQQGQMILQMCRDTKCAVVNHLRYGNHEYGGGRSFKKQSWISELDVCVASWKAVPMILKLKIENEMRLPSDHAPLEVTLDLTKCNASLESTFARTEGLGMHVSPKHGRQTLRGPPLHQVEEAAFHNAMRAEQPPDAPLDLEYIDTHVMQLNDALNRVAMQAHVRQTN